MAHQRVSDEFIVTKSQIPSLIDATSDDLLSGLCQKRFTSVELVNAYNSRINEVNSIFHVVMELNPDALSIARDLDLERSQGRLRGPLHGLPVLIKGNIGTRDQMQTNAGSYALQGAVLTADSTAVTKLRDHGLIILGKTNLSEWSMLRSNNSTHAWSAISGQAYGAYYANQCPGGSSGGSAVAADLGLAWAAIGTETSGSITSPSERNNVVGIKPTVGLTSRYLIVPVSEHQDTVGPIARTVKDAAKLLQVIAGPDPNDSYTSKSPYKISPPNYLDACNLYGLQGKRIGIARNVIEASLKEVSYILPAFENAITAMTNAGATIVENTDFLAFSKWRERAYNPVTRADFVSNLAQYLGNLEHNPHNILNIQGLRDFIRKCPEEEYPHRNTRSWDIAIERKLDNTSPEFWSLYQENMYLGGEGGIMGALERHGLDAVALPSKIAFEIPALVGTPIITVPLGAAPSDTPIENDNGWDVVETAPGIPFGISFLGAKWSEEVLIEIAYAFEQANLIRGTIKRHCGPCKDLVGVGVDCSVGLGS